MSQSDWVLGISEFKSGCYMREGEVWSEATQWNRLARAESECLRDVSP